MAELSVYNNIDHYALREISGTPLNEKTPGMLSLALVLGPWLSLRTKLQSLVLALALNLQSLILSLALRVESLVLALALKVSPWSWP